MTRNSAYCGDPCLNKGISCNGSKDYGCHSGYVPCHRPLFIWRASSAVYTKSDRDPHRQRCEPDNLCPPERPCCPPPHHHECDCGCDW